MSDRSLTAHATLEADQRIALRDRSGRLYGYLDRHLCLEVKARGGTVERIELAPILRTWGLLTSDRDEAEPPPIISPL